MKMNKVIFQIYPHFIKKMEEFYLENEKKEKEIQELNSQLKGAQKQNQEYKDWDKWGKSI